MPIDRVQLPNGDTEEVRDSRISGVDSAPTSGSANLVTSGGVKSALDGKMNIGGTVSDFNTETTPGNYAIDYTVSANRPSINYGQALVLNAATDTVAQLAFNYNSGSAYFRGGSSWGSTWNSWREFAFKDDLSGYLPLTGGTLNSAGTSSGATLPLRLLNPDPTGDTFIGLSNGTDNIKFGLRGPYSSFGLTIVDPSNNYYKIWHAGNDGAGSGLDADLLDGYNSSRYYLSHNHALLSTEDGFINAPLGIHQVQGENCATNPLPVSYGTLITFGDSNEFFNLQLSAAYDASRVFIRGINAYSSVGNWHELAFTDSNIASATKLQTARSIWGQPFDGHADVSGAMTGVTSIDSLLNFDAANGRLGVGTDSPYAKLEISSALSAPDATNVASSAMLALNQHNNDGLFFGYASPGDYGWIQAAYFGTSNNPSGQHTYQLSLNPLGGNVGIGTVTAAYKLDVAGDIRSNGLTFPRDGLIGNISAPGWYTIYEGIAHNAYGNSVILYINRQFYHNSNESYTIAVNGVYSGKIKFLQLNAAVNTQLITKIRVVYVNSGSYIIQLYYNGTVLNPINVAGVGQGTFCTPSLNDSPTGTPVEFALETSGVVSDGGITTTLQTSEPSGGMLPNREYQLGTLSGNTTFALAAGTSGVTNHYFWSFETGSTAPTITWPSGITSWAGGSAPSINSDRHYEVSVLNGVAVVLEV